MAIKTENEFKDELISYLKDAKEVITEDLLTFVIITSNEQYRYYFSTLDPVTAGYQDNRWWILISWEGDGNDFDPYERLEVSEKFYQEMLKLINIAVVAKSNEPNPKTILEQLIDKIKAEQVKINKHSLSKTSVTQAAVFVGKQSAFEDVLRWIEELNV